MPDSKISIRLSGGVDNRTQEELVSPVLQQGAVPKLKQSINTRLSVIPAGVARSPKFVEVEHELAPAIPGADSRLMVTSAAGRNTLLLGKPGRPKWPAIYGDAGRSAEGQTTFDNAQFTGPNPQLNAVTAHVVSARSLPVRKATEGIAVAYDEVFDATWTAHWSGDGGLFTEYTLCVSVRGADGAVYAGPYEQASWNAGNNTSGPPWCGLTSHGAGGVCLWWVIPSTGTLYVRNLSLPLFSSSPFVVTTFSTGYTHGYDVCSGGEEFAYFIGHASGGAATILKYEVAAKAIDTTASLAGAMTGGGSVAISSEVVRGTRYVVACANSITNDNNTWVGLSENLASLWTSTVTYRGRVSCGFLDCGPGVNTIGGANPIAVLFVNQNRENADYWDLSGPNSARPTRVRVETHFKRLDTAGAISTGAPLLWATLQSHVAHWSPEPGVIVPVFATGVAFGPSNTRLGEDRYVDDPCLTLHAIWKVLGAPMPFARLGVVRGVLAPAANRATSVLVSKPMAVHGQRLHVAYRQQSETDSVPHLDSAGGTGRVVELDFTPRQCPVAHDREGAAMIAAAFPLTWDGRELFDLGGMLTTPYAILAPTGGTEDWSACATGVYRFRALYRWTDATGTAHRSRPSKLLTTEYTAGGSGLGPQLMVARPYSITRADVERLVYISDNSGAGKTEHLAGMVVYVDGDSSSLAVPQSAAYPMIYTTEAEGAERGPQPPPPARDIAIVGSRCWILDAEVPSRYVYSKLRIAGIGYEFHPSFEVILPSGAGEGMAVREWQGVPVFLAQYGVYQASGDGPLNNGLNGSYSAPVQISDYGCSNTASVVTFPGGIMWQYEDRFAMLTGTGVQLVPDFLCTHDVSATAVLTGANEVLFFSATVAEVRVYNYEVGRWTTWDSDTLPEPVQQASALPYDPDTVLVYSKASGKVRRLEAGTFSAAPHMTLATDWVLLGGDFQDHVIIRELVFSAAISGPHGLEIDLWMDYETAASTHREWTAMQVTGLGGAAARYTVRVTPDQHNCRAFRVRVRDVVDPLGENTRGMAPRSLTVGYALDGAYYEEIFNEVSDV